MILFVIPHSSPLSLLTCTTYIKLVPSQLSKNHDECRSTFLVHSIYSIIDHLKERIFAAFGRHWKPFPSNSLGSISFFAVVILDYWLLTWLLHHICMMSAIAAVSIPASSFNHAQTPSASASAITISRVSPFSISNMLMVKLLGSTSPVRARSARCFTRMKNGKLIPMHASQSWARAGGSAKSNESNDRCGTKVV